jgi:aquaporin Z
MIQALKQHWPEYLMEAALLGMFMISACLFGILLEHPASPVAGAIPDPILRRILGGLAMGLTAVGLIYSPWGKRSGAHFNPSVTLTFLRLGKIEYWDASFYILAQFAGGLAGVVLTRSLVGSLVTHPSVNYVVTVPGARGPWVAFVAEIAISFFLMSVILRISNTRSLNRYTGLFAGALVATYISIEAPLSGMSMNPARTLGSAIPAHVFSSLWVYFTAPLLGMMLAAQIYLWQKGAMRVLCAKLHHENAKRCIFRCNYAAMQL